MSPKLVAFFCDECGVRINTGSACPSCKRVLCFEHFYGAAAGPFRRKDGLCAKCAQSSAVAHRASLKSGPVGPRKGER